MNKKIWVMNQETTVGEIVGDIVAAVCIFTMPILLIWVLYAFA